MPTPQTPADRVANLAVVPAAEFPGTAAYAEAGAELSAYAAAMHETRLTCVWTEAMTHAGLRRYLLEETHELLEALDEADPVHVREELGDLLLQIVFHAEIAAGDPDAGFDLADVVRDAREKMVRRHPHVFGPEGAADVDEVLRVWGAAKAAEKSERTGILDGIAPTLPALARAQKVAARIARAGVSVESNLSSVPAESSAPLTSGLSDTQPAEPIDTLPAEVFTDEQSLGDYLFRIAAEAQARGLDAESALRTAATRRAERA
ncbi:MazG nucleotide pyrophosphohydrolase domain-containing protein [Mycetocola saprophilus]|uniref:MazG nucleotide pyrophosphohydrolase domain-containing protein n=1 Tax=Mycetocola saprophilus TaxID=76636 RepID=UPI00068CB3C8|nr:MazG nucleotide pyrophosphohydrolase domain-containing protein [Mycetocola saprophilus]